MKGTPFKTLRSSPFMQPEGGVGGKIPIDPSAGEGSVDPKVGRVKQSEIDYSKGEEKVAKTAKGVENVANVAPISGEIIDAKNAVRDLIAGDYGGAALNAAGFAIPFVPGGVIKGGVEKAMSWLRKQPGADDAIKKGKKILEESGPTGIKPKGGVDAGDVKWKKDLHVGNKIEDAEKVAEFKLNEMRGIGKNLDEMNFDATKLTKKDVKFRGVIGKRSVVEVKLPNGETQLFYKSTDFSGKGVEDMWQPYAGNMDLPGNESWFIKDLSEEHAAELLAKGQQPLIPNVMGKSGGGFKEFYDSKSFRDISGNLDRIAVEGDFQKHITKGQGYASKR